MKKDIIKENKISHVDYKDLELLSKFVNQHGRMIAKRHTGLSDKNQKKVEKAIKRARFMALMPYVKS
ncbi:30S ribosomal protein S18 [Candidatus Campbellbacteria bacterium]|nr:MAG: 30S ribosomal protein S18 [Candidatus Campbellbacteria bacterium]